MSGFSDENKIIKDLAKVLTNLSVSELSKLAKGKKKLSKSYHVAVLDHVLKDEIWNIRLQGAITSKGLGNDFFARLEHFSDFTESMLINLLVRIEKVKPELKTWYLENIWVMFVQVGEQLEITESMFNDLLKQAETTEPANESLVAILKATRTLFADSDGYVDGVLKGVYDTRSFQGATVSELTDFAKKNKVVVPTKILKSDLVTGVLDNTPKEKLTDEYVAEIKKMTVSNLKKLIAEEKLPVTTDLKKQDIATLIARDYKPMANEVAKIMEFKLFEKEIAKELLDSNPQFLALKKENEELQSDVSRTRQEVANQQAEIRKLQTDLLKANQAKELAEKAKLVAAPVNDELLVTMNSFTAYNNTIREMLELAIKDNKVTIAAMRGTRSSSPLAIEEALPSDVEEAKTKKVIFWPFYLMLGLTVFGIILILAYAFNKMGISSPETSFVNRVLVGILKFFYNIAKWFFNLFR